MARPKLNDQDKRITQVNIRLTFDEHVKVTEAASASGLSPANWIRIKIFTGKFPPVKMSPLDSSLYLELKKIGVNLNQATHKINAGQFPKEYLPCLIKLVEILNRILIVLTDDRQPDKRKRV